VGLHVDIDPRAGKLLEEERERDLRLLTDYDPPPTFVIDSGRGLQGFWRLAEPLVLGGDKRRAEMEAEPYNTQIERDLGAGACHNVDRVMRLPGTINVPNARKRNRGFIEPSTASVVLHEPNRVCSLDRFRRSEVGRPAARAMLSLPAARVVFVRRRRHAPARHGGPGDRTPDHHQRRRGRRRRARACPPGHDDAPSQRIGELRMVPQVATARRGDAYDRAMSLIPSTRSRM